MEVKGVVPKRGEVRNRKKSPTMSVGVVVISINRVFKKGEKSQSPRKIAGLWV